MQWWQQLELFEAASVDLKDAGVESQQQSAWFKVNVLIIEKKFFPHNFWQIISNLHLWRYIQQSRVVLPFPIPQQHSYLQIRPMHIFSYFEERFLFFSFEDVDITISQR